MSIEIMAKIWRRLDVAGGELTLALALGDFANDHGESIWPSVATLSFKTRQGERTVRRQLARFREVKWLEVVTEGGLAGGRGKTTVYRINPEWLKGAELAGFPDVKDREFADEKGANLAGLPSKGCQPRHETLPSATVNPATAVAGNPSLTTKNLRGEDGRAIPSGSPASPAEKPKTKAPPEPPPYDEIGRRGFWNSVAAQCVIDDAVLWNLVPRGTAWHELPDAWRRPMAEHVNRWVVWCIDREMERVVPFREIHDRLIHELRTEMRQYKPPTPAERASAAA